MPQIITIITLAVIFLILISIKIVKQQTAYTVETFGKYTRTLFPGLNLVIPIIENTAKRVNLSTMNLDCSMLAITSDKVNITIDTTLIYRIVPERIYEAAYSLDNPVATIRTLVENTIRSFVATQTHEEIIRSRDEMTVYLIQHTREKIESFGYYIDSFQVRDVNLPKDITEAMSRVVSSKRLQEAAINESEAEYIRKVKEAEAQRMTRKLQGEGLALERKAIIDGLRDSIQEMSQATGIGPNAVINLVMMNQYMDTMRNLAKDSDTKTVFLNPGPGGMQDVMQSFSEMVK
jgi:regulator of protease activity HflC (stomatin/prohibitin superfamily)